MVDQLVWIFVLILGGCVGSFLNVVILRLPQEGKSIVFPGSHCPQCQKSLTWFDNIPLLSFLALRGKCRFCRTSISWQYPLVELAMAVLSLALYLKFSLSVLFGIYFVFSSALLAIIVIDFRHQIIPDRISLPGIIVGFGLSFVNPLVSWQDSGIGLLLGGGVLYGVAAGYYLVTRREGMGGGDIKLLAMIGAFLGWQSLAFVIFASSLLGAVAGIGAMVRQKKGGQTVIPYGPFLSGAALIFMLFREKILHLLILYFSAPPA